MKMRSILSLIFLFIFTSITYGQILEKGHAQFRLSQQFISSDSYFNEGSLNSLRETKPIRTNSIYSTLLSGQYGISDRLSVMGLFPVFVRVTVNGLKYNQSGTESRGGALNSFGDAELGLRYAIRKAKPVQIVAFVTLGIPFGKRGDLTDSTNLQTGDGELNQIAGIELRHSLADFNFSGYTSFNNRSENYSNEIRYGFEAGYSGSVFGVKIRYNVIKSLFNEDGLNSLNGIFSNHREVFSPGIEASFTISKKFTVFVSSDFITAGRNTLNAPLWSIGIQLKR